MNAPDQRNAWYWEGNVVNAIERHLAVNGWAIVSKADTLSHQRGPDLHAKRDNCELLIEAKGYPSKSYQDPARATEVKPTKPNNQAQHWYSHALLKVMRLKEKNPNAMVAIGLPDFERYRALFDETRSGLAKLGVVLMFVDELGNVTSPCRQSSCF
jgi:hypothetical protein